ncbi:MAG: hypothetical protein QOG45_2225, partial [Chloroflexota bacterium]|nr:hypothetical protein [Chloroflexota bacterium]
MPALFFSPTGCQNPSVAARVTSRRTQADTMSARSDMA